MLFVQTAANERMDVTSCRDALDGYQKGHCFYCFRAISIAPGSQDQSADVDHFLPHVLVGFGATDANLNGIWNLVLACRDCNRGQHGKGARAPELRYLERLHRRNNYLIDSHHPLRETLISQTGASESARHRFLQQQHSWAKARLIHSWAAPDELETAF